jgi:hypothetical protein
MYRHFTRISRHGGHGSAPPDHVTGAANASDTVSNETVRRFTDHRK